MPVLYMRATCSSKEIADTLGRILPKVFASLMDLCVRPVGPPFCRYTAWRGDECDLEGGVLVDGLVSGVGEVEGGEIGGCKAVYTLHQGAYTELHEAYDAMQAWMKDHGKTAAIPPFELYVTDPGKVPDPMQWKTEVFWPVAE